MNERIDKLIEQCTRQNFSDCVGGYETFDKEKFAMLIVEECRNVLTDVYREVPLECSGHLMYADEVLAKHFYGIDNNIIRSE